MYGSKTLLALIALALLMSGCSQHVKIGLNGIHVDELETQWVTFDASTKLVTVHFHPDNSGIEISAGLESPTYGHGSVYIHDDVFDEGIHHSNGIVQSHFTDVYWSNGPNNVVPGNATVTVYVRQFKDNDVLYSTWQGQSGSLATRGTTETTLKECCCYFTVVETPEAKDEQGKVIRPAIRKEVILQDGRRYERGEFHEIDSAILDAMHTDKRIPEVMLDDWKQIQ
ncbi:MAG: hypothetical protein WC107_03360 [Patescibacteria group bacterium]